MLERKGLGIRLVASILDGIIISIVGNVLVAVLGIVGVVLAALLFIGYPLLEIATAQSIGKMILKLKVYSENGAPATRDQLMQRAMIRWIGTIIAGVTTLSVIFAPTLTFLGPITQVVVGIILLVLSMKTLSTLRQAFWDVKARTAVMGPVTAGAVPFMPAGSQGQGFTPIMPGQPMPPAGTPMGAPGTMPPPTQM